jgi:hypothetical protein
MDIRTLSPGRLALALITALSVLALSACQQPASPAAPVSDASAAATPPAPPYIPPTADQLYQLVAPIALFPDKLVAQTLAASVYPDQVSSAQGWLHDNSALSMADRLQAAATQPWDPSVKALTAFPDVINQLAGNVDWTRALGDAYSHDPNDVLDAIQVMRQRAQANGHLRSTPQQRVQVVQRTVVTPASDEGLVPPPSNTIVIEPAQPDTVYVPQYDPNVVYGAPVDVYGGYRYRQPRVYDNGDLLATGIVSFGVGVLIGSALDHHHGPMAWIEPEPAWHRWGWNNWGVNWNAPPASPHYVVYQNRVYAPRTTIINNNTRIDERTYNIHQDQRFVGMPGTPSAPATVASAAAPAAAMAMAQRGPGPHAATPQLASAPRNAPDYAYLSAPHFNAQMLQPGRPVTTTPAAQTSPPVAQAMALAPHDPRAQPQFTPTTAHAPMPHASMPSAHAAMPSVATIPPQQHNLPASMAQREPAPQRTMPQQHNPIASHNVPTPMSMPARPEPQAQAQAIRESPRPQQHQQTAFAPPHPQRQQPPMPQQHPVAARTQEPHQAPHPQQAHHDPHKDHDKRDG